MVTVDQGRLLPRQVAKTLILFEQLTVDLFRPDLMGEELANESAKRSHLPVAVNERWNIAKRRQRRVKGQARMPAQIAGPACPLPARDTVFSVWRSRQQNRTSDNP